MALRKGSTLVYPGHGVMRLTDRETLEFGGTQQTYLVMAAIDNDLVIRVPEGRAEQLGLRATVNATEAEEIFAVLADEAGREPGNWSRRMRRNQERLLSGDVYTLAELVRDLSQRLKSQGGSMSPSEQSLLADAERQLVGELAQALRAKPDVVLNRVRSLYT